jgi:hypothetical protein
MTILRAVHQNILECKYRMGEAIHCMLSDKETLCKNPKTQAKDFEHKLHTRHYPNG